MTLGSITNTRARYQIITLTFSVGGVTAPLVLWRRDTETMLIAGAVKDLIAPMFLASDGSQYVTAALAVIRLEQEGDADDGKFWDGDSWETVLAAPASTHIEAGQHLYQLPVGATTGRSGATIHFTFTDDTDEGAALTVCPGGEHVVRTVIEGLTATQDARIPAALVGGAMDSDVSNMQTDAISADAVSTGAVTKIQLGLASQASVDAIQNVTRVAITCPQLVIPDSGSIDYKIFFNMFDTAGNPEDPDGPDVIDVTAENQAGVSRDANLDGVPTGRMTKIGVGRYVVEYTVASTHLVEQIIFRFAYSENAIAFVQDRACSAVSGIEALATQVSVDAIATAVGLLNDLSSGDVDTVISANAAVVLMRKVLTNRRETNGVTGKLDIYNDADTAVEFSIDIFEDVAAAIPYRERGINRQDQIT